MIWDLALAMVHFAAAAGFIALYKSAPCWMQKVAVAGFVLATAVLGVGFALGVAGVWGHGYVELLGLVIADLALLVYVFRLVYQTHLQWKPSSTPFHSS